jgi:hypothetical protein
LQEGLKYSRNVAFEAEDLQKARKTLLHKLKSIQTESNNTSDAAAPNANEHPQGQVVELCHCNNVTCAAAFMLVEQFYNQLLCLNNHYCKLSDGTSVEISQLKQSLESKSQKL